MSSPKLQSGGVVPLGIVNIIFGALGLIGTLIQLLFLVPWIVEKLGASEIIAPAVLYVLAFLSLVMALLLLLSGIGLAARARWGAILGLMWSIFAILTNIAMLVGALVVVFSADFAHAYQEAQHTLLLWQILIFVVSMVLPIINLVANIRFLKSRPAPVRRDTSQTPAPLPPPPPPPAYQEPGTMYKQVAVDTLSIRIIRDGRLCDTKNVPLTDTLGQRRRIIVGRSSRCDITIPQDPYVSEEHCMFELDAGKNLMLSNLRDTHGTFIVRGDERIRVNGARPVFSNDRILLGPYTELIVEILRPLGRTVSVLPA